MEKVAKDNSLAILKSLTLVAISQYMVVKIIMAVLIRLGYMPFFKFNYIDMIIVGALFFIDFILLVDKPGKKVKRWYLLVYFFACFVGFIISSLFVNR